MITLGQGEGNPPQSYFDWGVWALLAVGALGLIRVIIASIATYYMQRVHLWDVATGKQVRRLEGHWDPVSCVAFSPNGKLLASGTD